MIIDTLLITIFAIGVGTIASMVGIGGGIINTPLLIIVFGFSAQFAPASSLVAALFVAISSTLRYHRQRPRPIINRAGLFLAVMTIPGSFVGVWLRAFIASVSVDDYPLRLIFGLSLFPVAIKMLFAKRRGKTDFASEVAGFDFSQIPQRRLVISLFGGFIGGVSAGLLGIGGGTVIVPVLTVLFGLPMHAAVATSMFTMIFTATSGTIINYLSGQIDIYYSIALGVGMLVGGQIGPQLAYRVDAVRLKHIFGLVLVFPLVKMMRLGQFWLGDDLLLSTIGDLIIWLIIVVPIGLFTNFYRKSHSSGEASTEIIEDKDG
jgi:uncharacterized membrane protein YfcA